MPKITKSGQQKANDQYKSYNIYSSFADYPQLSFHKVHIYGTYILQKWCICMKFLLLIICENGLSLTNSQLK